jgi:hypothetical protein
MPDRASARVRERDVAGPFRVPPPRSGDDTANHPGDPAGDHPANRINHGPAAQGAQAARAARADLHRAVMRIGEVAGRRLAAGSYVTVRGAMVAMFGIFLVCSLAASWLNVGVLIGLGYVACCVLAPFLVRPQAQLHVVIAPPAIFMAAVILTQVVTAQGSSRHGRILSVLEGTLLTLAAVAPWLFAGTALGAGASATRGLRECVREVKAEFGREAGAGTGGLGQQGDALGSARAGSARVGSAARKI